MTRDEIVNTGYTPARTFKDEEDPIDRHLAFLRRRAELAAKRLDDTIHEMQMDIWKIRVYLHTPDYRGCP